LSGVVHLLNIISVPATLSIAGTALPTKDVVNVLEDVATIVVKHEPFPKALERLAPDIIPILLEVSGTAIPYVGFAVAGVVLMIKYSKPPTQEDQQRMWDQAQGLH
jgi:hypothetical protein